MTLYAKSDGTTLEDHTYHVVCAIETIARNLLPDMTNTEYRAAQHGAILHDLGKAHPHFQASLRKDFVRPMFVVPHRHEISSLLFLPLFPQEEWSQLIDMVIAHHKSLKSPPPPHKQGKGLNDLTNRYRASSVFDLHAENWEEWSAKVYCFLPRYGVTFRDISLEEARAAFDYVVLYCSKPRTGRNRWRGLLMAADHLASALQEDTEVRAADLFRSPDLAVFHKRAKDADAEFFPLAKKEVHSTKPHTLVVAPTGSGKTDFLLRRCSSGRVFYILPFQASINAMYLRMERMLNFNPETGLLAEHRTDIRRVHAAAQIEIDDEVEEETILQKHPGAALKVMTPHQVASLIFGLPGHEAVALDIARQNVVLDEVHVYSEQTQAMVLELVKALIRLGCRVHVGSATIPTALGNELRHCLGGEEAVYEARLSQIELSTYDRHIVDQLDNEAAAREYVRKCVAEGKRILFVSNRVATAQVRYEWVQDNFPDVPKLLVHSRYRRGDRSELEQKIAEMGEASGPCVVCSTQIIEVSLDISYDTLVTDCAPLDSLIQRFGRVNRWRMAAGLRSLFRVAVIAPPNDVNAAKPYALITLQETWKVLPNGSVLQETSLQKLIDQVYPTVDVKPIDKFLVETDQGFKLPELCHYPKSALIEAMEIDTASVICSADLELYRKTWGKQRLELEIPVPVTSLRCKFKAWAQIEEGTRPFVCPDQCYDAALGLLLGEKWEPSCIIL